MRSENYERETQKVPVHVVMRETGESAGAILIPFGSKLDEIINDGNPFLVFEDQSGARSFLSKAAVIRIDQSRPQGAGADIADGPPSAEALLSKLKQFASGNPYRVLGIAPDADRAAVSEAYHALVREYHPDRLSGMDLPAEMVEHGQKILTLLNQAHERIMAEIKQSAA